MKFPLWKTDLGQQTSTSLYPVPMRSLCVGWLVLYNLVYWHSISFPCWDIIAFRSWKKKITVLWKQKHNSFLVFFFFFFLFVLFNTIENLTGESFISDTVFGMKVYITLFRKCFIGNQTCTFLFWRQEQMCSESTKASKGHTWGDEFELPVFTAWKLPSARRWWEQTTELQKAYVVI